MISIQETVYIHNLLIKTFGGSSGVRDFQALESALSRPFQKFDNVELYPSIIEKAASLLESLLANHPFVDGNKRTGYVLMRLFLKKNGMDIIADEETKYQFVIDVASGVKRYDDILIWLEDYVE
jgi:death-on-curing protein